VVPSKLVPTAVPGTAVHRRSLVQRLDELTEHKLVLLVAPPGYGKSVLLAQWAGTSAPRRIAWLTVEATDDADRFARHLCAALTAADGRPRDGVLGRVERSGRRMGPGFLAALLADAPSMPATAVVLDDFHTMQNPDLLAEIGLLVEEAPAQLHFVLAARMDPALPSYRLRLNDELGELRQDDLVFDSHDARQLISRISHRDLTSSQLDALVDRTEGWGAGLHLAALSLRRVRDVDGFVSAFAGDDRPVAEHLTEHVLRHQPTHVRRFLLRTSVLRRLTASLCDAVTLGQDGQAMLEHLDRGSLFINRLDDRREWFRYHELFRTLLRQHLHESDEEDERELLERAARWHLAHDDVETGVSYLTAAGADGALLDAVRSHGYAMCSAGRVAAPVRWIDAVDPAEGRRCSEVPLLRAALHTMAGDTLAADVMLADVAADEGMTTPERMVGDVIHTWSVHDRPVPRPVMAAATRSLATLERASRSEIPDVLGLTTPAGIRRTVLLNGGAAAAYDGRAQAAREWIRRAKALADVRAAPDVYAFGLGALLDAWGGRLRSAREQAAHALAKAEQSTTTPHPGVVTARLALAHVARERDELDEAEALLAATTSELQRTRPSVLLAVQATEQASLALARGQLRQGLRIVAEHRAADVAPPPPAVAARLGAVEARLLLANGELEGAQLAADRAPAVGCDIAAVRVQIAVDRGDLAAARTLLARWPPDGEPGAELQRRLWRAILDDVEGAAGSDAEVAAVVAAAQEEGWVALFLDAGHHAVHAVRRLHGEAPTPYLRHLVDDRIPPSPARRPPVEELVERFSNRERAVLRYLPSRLDNAEIAAELRVSINTLKTHLKHIYRKLGVDGRKSAIEAAERLHLL
jgi:LuxR family maltose regulon positive regulatory protein